VRDILKAFSPLATWAAYDDCDAGFMFVLHPKALYLVMPDRFARASSWTFFIVVCSGLQQISQRSRLSFGVSCLPSLAPLMLMRAHPRFWSDSRKQQSQMKVVFVPMRRLEPRTWGRARKNRRREPAALHWLKINGQAAIASAHLRGTKRTPGRLRKSRPLPDQ
jgi:hypothetical protein